MTDIKADATGFAHDAQLRELRLVRDVWGGTFSLLDSAAVYLPRYPMETSDAYNVRKGLAVLNNALRKSVEALVGLVFRKDPALQADVPDEIVEDAENIDLAGRALAVFARDVARAAMRDGHTHIFIDYPTRANDGGVLTLADTRSDRPWWVHVEKADLLRFATETRNGETLLTMAAFRESGIERINAFEEAAVERVRQYELADGGVQFTVFRSIEKDKWVLESSGLMRGISRIPLVTVYGARTGYMESTPVLLDLAQLNVAHFRLWTDRQYSMHIACTPVPIFVGLQQDSIVVGSGQGIRLPTGGQAFYLESAGNGLSATRDELQDLESRMAVQGLAMLQRDFRAAETADAKRMDKVASDSQLAAFARNLKDGLEEALGLHAEWRGIEDGGSIEVNRDFTGIEMSADQIRAYSDLVERKHLSLDTLWARMQASGNLPDDFDFDIERDRIEEASEDDGADLGAATLRLFGGNADETTDDTEDDESEDEDDAA